MNYPGNQITAGPDQQRRYLPEEHPSGPIGPFGPIRDGFDRDQDELSAAVYGDYALPGHQEPRRGRGQSPAPVPQQRRGRHASGGNDGYDQAQRPRQDPRSQIPRQRGATQSAPRGTADGGTSPARGVPPASPFPPHGRGPANGYPPRPGAPAPRYRQDEFSAWNQPAKPPDPALEQLMASAPTWADTGDAGGVALAERPGSPARYSDDLAGYSDVEVEVLAADFIEVTTLAVEDPVITGVDEEPPVTGEPRRDGREVRTAAGRSRAAAAKARKAARRKGRTRRRVVVAGVCLPAVAAVAAIAVMHHSGKQTPVAAGLPGSPSAAAPSTSASKNLGPWQHIGTRAGDPAPLTLGQLFPATFSSDGSYVRTAEAGSDKCTSAVFGSALQSAVRKHGCSQVMRASYLSTATKMMGTIGVLDLTNSTAASAVGKVTGSSEFVAQLTARSGPTHNLTKGTGLEEAEVKGHYLILTWVEFTSLHAPHTSAEKAQLKTFSADLINQTANVSLTSRMVTGNPQMP